MNMKRKDISKLTKDIKRQWHTNDPFFIAEKLGIVVSVRSSSIPDFTAQTLKPSGYPTMIAINSAYDEMSRKILCAHELGHAILHNEGINHYTIAGSIEQERIEVEANLFAITLLDENINQRVNMPVERMPNYLLKAILDYNLHKD